MPFSIPFKDSAIAKEPTFPWPIHGLAYVAMFMGPLSSGLLSVLLAGSFVGILLGALLGPALSFGNAWVFNHYVEFWIAKQRARLGKGLPFVLINIAAFAWSILLSAPVLLTPPLLFITFNVDIFTHSPGIPARALAVGASTLAMFRNPVLLVIARASTVVAFACMAALLFLRGRGRVSERRFGVFAGFAVIITSISVTLRELVEPGPFQNLALLFCATLPLLLALLFVLCVIFDRLLRIQFSEAHAKWEQQGCPSGYFWAPAGSRKMSLKARGNLLSEWVRYPSPSWVRNSPEASRLLGRVRLLLSPLAVLTGIAISPVLMLLPAAIVSAVLSAFDKLTCLSVFRP